MNRRRGIGTAGIWLGGLAGMLAGCAVWAFAVRAERDEPRQGAARDAATEAAAAPHADSAGSGVPSDKGETPGKARSESNPAQDAVSAKPADAEYVDPSAVAKRFAAELTRLVKRGNLVTPAELHRQAQAAKRCPVVPVPDPGEKLGPAAIYARARPSVVVVGAIVQPKGHRRFHAALASGFVIAKEGVIATNYHVIEAFQHAKAVGVMTADQRLFAVQAVVAADAHNDLALVKIEADNLVPLPIASSVQLGAPVYCLSHPALDTEETETAFFAFSEGVVSGKYRLRLDGPVPIDVLTVTAEYGKGSSGGPILNEHGAVVGIICQTRALFHDEDETEPQMTWKLSRPSSSLLALLKPAD